MKLNKELANTAKRKGVCKEWFNRLQNTEDKGELIKMYLEGIDFCLSNEFPTNAYIREHFVGTCEAYGVFLDETINVVNSRFVVALGTCEGSADYSAFGVGQVFIKHDSRVHITASDNAFVMVDIFDNSEVTVTVKDNAKVCVNNYGGKLSITTDSEPGNAIIKVISKHSKTY
jgi:hypothetical protein